LKGKLIAKSKFNVDLVNCVRTSFARRLLGATTFSRIAPRIRISCKQKNTWQNDIQIKDTHQTLSKDIKI
jgi:hypothetical protein